MYIPFSILQVLENFSTSFLRFQLKNSRSPFATITKHLKNTVKALKHKDKLSKWQEIVERIQRKSIDWKNRKEAENIQRKRLRVFQEAKRVRADESIGRSGMKRKKQDNGFMKVSLF